MTTTRRSIPALLVIAALAAASSAAGAVQVHKLTGTFDAEGVPGTGSVSLKVIVRDGSPVRITGLSFKGLPARCNQSEDPSYPSYVPAGSLSGGGGKNSNGDGIEFGRRLMWVSYPAQRQVLMNGRLSKSGKRISGGKLEVHNNAPGACQSAVGKFTAKK